MSIGPSFLILLVSLDIISSANILAIFPFSAKSHFTMYEALLNKLHKRHHEITVISHFPKISKLRNYTDISLVGSTVSLHANMSLKDHSGSYGLYSNLKLLNDQIDDYEAILQVSAVNKLINSNQTFDLIITEIFNSDLFLGFVYKFKCPYVSMSASPLMPWAYERAGVPIRPFEAPLVFSNRKNPMNIFSKIMNAFEWGFTIFYYKYFMNYKSQMIANKYFRAMPPLDEVAKSVNFILVNTHFSLHPLGVTSPRLIEVGGMHIGQPNKLPKELGLFLDEAENGVIVFSMGSMFRTESLPEKYFHIFINTFSKLKQRVLWKWENSTTPKMGKNIKCMKWLPQRDVLEHDNVRLFIYHGGLLGVSEAVHCGVPILGLPQFGDMSHNLAMVSGAGLTLDLPSLTEQTLYKAINTLLSQPRYKQEAMKLSEKFRDRPVPPLDLAVFWTEYAIRHGHSGQRRAEDNKWEIIFNEFHYIIIVFSLSIFCLFLKIIHSIFKSILYKKNKIKIL